jgi:hypothetical protein
VDGRTGRGAGVAGRLQLRTAARLPRAHGHGPRRPRRSGDREPGLQHRVRDAGNATLVHASGYTDRGPAGWAT